MIISQSHYQSYAQSYGRISSCCRKFFLEDISLEGWHSFWTIWIIKLPSIIEFHTFHSRKVRGRHGGGVWGDLDSIIFQSTLTLWYVFYNTFGTCIWQFHTRSPLLVTLLYHIVENLPAYDCILHFTTLDSLNT